ncbi:MAG: hypothetical protein ACI9DM_002518, partial [Cyclobacteriaceae bacterium]
RNTKYWQFVFFNIGFMQVEAKDIKMLLSLLASR